MYYNRAHIKNQNKNKYYLVKSNAMNRGFTLIEIVIVLVILGILTSITGAKYFDLTDDARRRVALASVAEAQSRINSKFGALLLNGMACPMARGQVFDLSSISDESTSKGARFGEVYLRPTILTGQNSTPMFDYELGPLGVDIILPTCDSDMNESFAPAFQQAMKTFFNLKGTENGVKIPYSVAYTLSSGAIESSGVTGQQYRDNGFYDELASTLGFNVNECEIGIYSNGSNKYTMYVVNGKFDNANALQALQQMAIGEVTTQNNFKYGTPTKTTNNVYSGQVYAMRYEFTKSSDGNLVLDMDNSLKLEKIYAWINTSTKGDKWLKFNSEKDLITP